MGYRIKLRLVLLLHLLISFRSCRSESIELKNYPVLMNVTNCVPQEQNGVHCIFSGGLSTSSSSLRDSDHSSLSVECLRRGVLVIKRAIEALKIKCSAKFPIDFEYDGVQPTEALLPLFSKAFWPNASSIPATSDLADHFPPAYYNVDLTIFGVKAQYDYFHEENNPFLSIKPSRGIPNRDSVKQLFTYPRTGRYMFRDIHTKAVLFDVYLFVEDPDSTPSFIRGKSTTNVKAKPQTDQLIFPCRPSHHDASLTLRKTSGNAIKKLNYTVDPTEGIIVNNLTSLSANELEGTYICEFKYDQNQTEEISFKYPPEEMPDGIFYGFENSPKMLPFKDLSLQITYIFYVIENVATVRPTCDATNLDVANSPELKLLTNIPCRNPMHCRLMREFVSPQFMNNSYTVEVGKLTDDLFSGLRLDSGLPFTYGITLCQSSQHFKAVEYGVSLDGRATAVSYAYDWLKLPGRTKAEIKIYLNIGIENQTDAWLYAKRGETFRCKFFSSVLIKPVLWLVEYDNGSLVFATLDSGFFGDTSYVNIKLDANMTAVHCAASLYYKNFWRRIVMPIDVYDGTPPRILVGQDQQNVRVKLGTPNHLLRCSAEGEPLPNLSWEKDGQVLTLILKSIPKANSIILEIPEVSSSTAGEYVCNAKSHLGNARHSLFVELENDGLNYWLLVGLPVLVFALTVIGFAVYIKFFRREATGLTREEVEAFMNGDRAVAEGARENDYLHEFSHAISYDTEFEIPATRFDIDHKVILGSGAFGRVLRGSVYGRTVAVKTLNRFADKNYLHALLSELKIMIFIGKHDSIVELVGAVTSQLRRGNLYIFVELCGNGSAEKYLRENRHKFVNKDKSKNYANAESVRQNYTGYFSKKTLMKWSLDIASAMEHLITKKVIHGDLAARNILLTDELRVKVTDFGLSRQLHNYSQYVKKQQEPLPWRWMALESLRDLSFSPQSDAWAYGVLLWELFSLAEVPYPGYTWNLDFVGLLEEGLRMACPRYAPSNIYNCVILECWRERPENRPTFAIIRERVAQFLTGMKDETDEFQEVKVDMIDSTV